MAEEQAKRVAEGGSVERAERKREHDLLAEAAEAAAFGKPAEGPKPAAPGSDGNFEPPKPAEKRWQIPEDIGGHFLRDGNKFHYAGGNKALAGVVKDDKLVSKTNDPIVARLFVRIAEASGAEALKVTGAEAWRREVWKEAAAHNIEVQGYKPTRLEIVEMELRRSEQNTVERAARQQAPAQAAPQQAPAQSAAAAKPPTVAPTAPQAPTVAPTQPPKPRGAPYIVTGKLVGSGHQPYGSTPRRGWNLTSNSEPGKATYYAIVQTEKGERVLWGDDIARALGESEPRLKIGDPVKVGNLGRHDFIPAPGLASVNRNVWVFEDPGSYEKRYRETHDEFVKKKPPAPAQDAVQKHRSELAEAFRKDAGVNTERMVALHPELLDAAASLRLIIAKAEQDPGWVVDIENVKSLLVEAFAGKIARGDPIRAPQIMVEAPERAQEQAQEMVRA